MTVLEFYNKLNTIKDLQHFKHFSFYFYVSILNDPDNAPDIDIKLVRRIKPVTVSMVEETMDALVGLGIDVVYYKEIETWKGKYRPTLKEIDESKPVLHAVLDWNLSELEKMREMDKVYQYRGGGVRYKQIGRLIFCKSAEWAVCGYKYNENWKNLPEDVRANQKEMVRLHNNGYLPQETSNHEMVADIEIREFLQTPNVSFLAEIEQRFRRVL